MQENAILPFIPENITVHLGPADTPAQNVTVPFLEYLTNVASSEIYPTWPENALRANIYAEASFALNRIYTEYYRSRGYDFDITNSTVTDQSYVFGREVFENIQQLVSEQFTDYIRREGSVEPLFAAYCDGQIVTCPGLSQRGSVVLAEQGLSPLEILKYYYGDDIVIVRNTPIAGIADSVPPGGILRVGSVGNDVRTLQIRLNRISDNYPSIPKIVTPDGVFAEDTERAVREFQAAFGLNDDGIVGRATWYAVLRVYTAVKRLNELTSEGLTLEEVSRQYTSPIQEGDRGLDVINVQYYLNYLSGYYGTIPSVAVDGVFGPATKAAVIDAQNTFGLPADGVVGRFTWEALYDAYLGIISTIPIEYTEGITIPYPGLVLRLGSESDAVKVLQEYLSYIAQFYPEIPSVPATGYYGSRTQEAVTAFQRQFGTTVNGIVEAATWNAITSIYEDLYRGSRLNDGQYPGYEIGA